MKVGDKLKFKKEITEVMKESQGIDPNFQGGKFTQDFDEQHILVQGWVVPRNWMELETPHGHHLTKIFK